VYCEQFVGEAKNMLYRLKNRMNIAVPKLKSLQDIHLYDDGTTITVRSVFGQDFIEINAGRAGFPSCSITILDLPLAVPPMKWYAPGEETFTKGEGGWVITGPDGKTEVEGVDYIKTYFSWVTRDCPSCSPLEFTVAKGDDANILTGSSPNRPFWYKSENDDGSLIYNYEGAMVPHHMGYDWTHPPIPPNPLKHTIYSLWGCQAQIIKNGSKWSFSDAGGSYFLWKAYTEWSNVGPGVVTFSRTGLGYMLMQAFIKNEGINLCETEGTIIKVDCCLKTSDLRQVILYWESLSGYVAGGPTCYNQPFMFYGSIQICEVPGTVGNWYSMFCVPKTPKVFYVIPEIKGGCLPFEWTVTGAGFTITKSEPLGETASLLYDCPSSNDVPCNMRPTVTVVDRCGTTDSVVLESCCEQQHGAGISIGYTSLIMACGAKQTLTVSGGCGPSSWSLSGGGELNTNTGSEVIYTAPGTNPNCTDNPTITVTDCCGSSAQVSLAVNCYTPAGVALHFYRRLICPENSPFCSCHLDYAPIWIYCGTHCDEYFLCNGELLSATYNDGRPLSSCVCRGSESAIWGCNAASEPCCAGGCCGGDILEDKRTQAMKDAGCCPINPLTGLPY